MAPGSGSSREHRGRGPQDACLRVDKVAAVVITSGYHFVCPQLIRGANGTARENRRDSERPGVTACVARSARTACRTSAPSWEQPVRGTRERL